MQKYFCGENIPCYIGCQLLQETHIVVCLYNPTAELDRLTVRAAALTADLERVASEPSRVLLLDELRATERAAAELRLDDDAPALPAPDLTALRRDLLRLARGGGRALDWEPARLRPLLLRVFPALLVRAGHIAIA